MGIVISLAIAGAIFQNRAVSNVLSILPDANESSLWQAITGMDSSYLATLSSTDRVRVISAVVSALSSVYIVVIVGGAVTVLPASFQYVTHLNCLQISANVELEK